MPGRQEYQHRGVLSVLPQRGWSPAIDDWRERMGVRAGSCHPVDGLAHTWSWNTTPVTEGDAVLLSAGARRDGRDAAAGEVLSSLDDPQSSTRYSSPYAAMRPAREGIQIAVDPLGFRQMYGRITGDVVAVSTSARALSVLTGDAPLNHEAVALQSQLGWQLGNQTLIRGVEVLPDTGIVDGTGYSPNPRPAVEARPTNNAVRDAADLLRGLMGRYLDEHPDAELQLTGGLDSRIILAAIPPSRRSGLRAMTLRAPESDDAAIAADISARYGLTHEVKDLSAPDWLDAPAAFEMCLAAAQRIEASADPIARAAVDLAEGALDDRPRIEGLGGEVARGFYYLGSPRWSRITDGRIRQLASWRLFANESVSADVFTTEFGQWASESALQQVGTTLRSESESDWFEAVDGLYLHQRMRRWAGALASATCLERVKFNPMLDASFLSIVHTLTPAEKQNAVFLARVLVELDPALADIPLDGRPSPALIASRALPGRILGVRSRLTKAARKVRGRLTGSVAPPAGGEALATLVVAHLRSDGDAIDALAAHDFISAQWLARFVDGRVTPSVATCSFLMNVLASGPRPGQPVSPSRP